VRSRRAAIASAEMVPDKPLDDVAESEEVGDSPFCIDIAFRLKFFQRTI